MIRGTVTEEGAPIVVLPIAGHDWRTLIDSGFNGDLELPDALRPHVNARFTMSIRSILAAGQEVLEDSYEVEFPFDGRVVRADATFVSGDEILLGTGLLREYRLDINFVTRMVVLERVANP